MYVSHMTNEEVEALKKELAEANAEIAHLRLRLGNANLLLRAEMAETGKLPKLEPKVSLRG
jgi:hypothetical protein